MNIKSYITKPFIKHFGLLGLFLVIYLTTRFYSLTKLPIFTDEAIYIRWSQIGLRDAAWRFIPLTDGKPPLYHWFVMVALKFIADPLFAARFVSVLAGFLNLILIWVTARVISKRYSVAHMAALLYLTSPFVLVYDRLAVVDGLLTGFSISSFLFAYLLAQTLRFDVAMILGVSIGAGLLTKANGLLFLILSPLHYLTVVSKKFKWSKFFRWLWLWLFAVVISQAIYSILRLSQFFYRIGQKNLEFTITFSDFLRHPFAMTWGNIKSLFTWQVGYLTLPICILIALAFLRKKDLKTKLVLLGYFLIPLLMISTFNKIIFPRFLLISTPFLLILAAYGLDLATKLKPVVRTLVITLALIVPAYISFIFITNPIKAPIVQADRDQYLDSWSSGVGINETVAYLKDRAASTPIYVGTQGTFGLMPYALEIYLADNPNIHIQSFWPVTKVPAEVLTYAEKQPTYFIYNELQEIPPQENILLIKEFKKGKGNWAMRLYQVLPSASGK
jgi:4-amino-4-deoxy-L-arabinose transferase-like glycosyltransferase